MTPDKINMAIADIIGEGDRYFVKKHGYYYRPGACGYTSNPDEAWRLPLSKAKKHEYVGDRIVDPVTIQQCPPRDFCGSLDAMAIAEVWLRSKSNTTDAGSLCYQYARALYNIVPSDLQPFMATARQRADAFLLVAAKYKEVKP